MVARCVLRLAAIASVAVAGCHRSDITDGRYQGMVELDQYDLGFEVAGRVSERAVTFGQAVRAGQVVARLDDSIERAQRAVRARDVEVARAALSLVEAGSRREDVEAARARLEAARASELRLLGDRDRARKLVEGGAMAKAQLDLAEAQYQQARGERTSLEEQLRRLIHGARAEELDQARAQLAVAEQALALEDRRLAEHVLESPVDGTVLDIYPEVGEVVAAGAPVVSVADRTRPYADVFVPVAEAPALQVGQPMEVVVEGVPGVVPGVVERIAGSAEFTPKFVYSPRERPNLTVRVRVRLVEPEARLHAGLPAYARPVHGGRRADVLAEPAPARAREGARR
jgi:HlyD family secretion protein